MSLAVRVAGPPDRETCIALIDALNAYEATLVDDRLTTRAAAEGDVPLVVELRAGGFADLNVMRPVMLGQPCFLRVAPAGR